MMRPQFTLGAFGIIFNEKREVLLCHRRDRDLWNLPGGGVEKNESPWEAVIREVKEESGFDVKIKYLSGVYFKREKEEVIFAFMCEIIGGVPTLNEEADAIEFFGVEKIPQKN